MPELKDGGTRKIYPTGAQKEDNKITLDKGRYDLLPVQPLMEIAKIYAKGAIKYRDRNWQYGLPLSRFVDSAIRHFFQYIDGQRDEDHIHMAIWNLLGLSYTEEMIKRGLLPKELDDLPSYCPKGLTDIEYKQENKLSDGFLYKKDKDTDG